MNPTNVPSTVQTDARPSPALPHRGQPACPLSHPPLDPDPAPAYLLLAIRHGAPTSALSSSKRALIVCRRRQQRAHSSTSACTTPPVPTATPKRTARSATIKFTPSAATQIRVGATMSAKHVRTPPGTRSGRGTSGCCRRSAMNAPKKSRCERE
eukprot:5593900-Pleurochrysis_carterae.AAC.3